MSGSAAGTSTSTSTSTSSKFDIEASARDLVIDDRGC
jgi:hypothetical protein